MKEAGGVAMILANTELNVEEESGYVHVLPANLIGCTESLQLKSYINSTGRPKAWILLGGSSYRKLRAPTGD